MTYYVGIDPGKTGGIVVLDNGQLSYVARFDRWSPVMVIDRALSLCDGLERIAVEKVHAMPGQGVTSMFTFGQGYGSILGALEAWRYEAVELITPQTWQKMLSNPSLPSKERVRSWIESQFGFELFIFPRARKPHQGCMDAAAIAYYLYLKDKSRAEVA